MTDTRSQSDLPSALEMLESVLLLVGGAVISAPMLPGFILCLPVLVMVAVVAVAPLVALALLVTLAGAIVAIPYLLVRSVRGMRLRRVAPAPESAPVPGC